MVLNHFHDPRVEAVSEVTLDEVQRTYKDYDPRIRRVVEKIPPGVQRWPLLVTGPLESWSSSQQNIVLMGDAAHSMTNHMAQGAATSMEDGAFLARCLDLVINGRATVADAVGIYEKGRMPKASYKQQVSFLNGWMWLLPDGPAQQARDKQMECELRGEVPMRSSNLYGDPISVQECYNYDAEKHADEEISKWLNNGEFVRDAVTTVQGPYAEKIANWFLPEENKFKIRPKM